MGASWRDGTVFFFAVLRDVAMTGAHDFRARAHHDLRLLEWLFDLFHPLLEFSLGLCSEDVVPVIPDVCADFDTFKTFDMCLLNSCYVLHA